MVYIWLKLISEIIVSALIVALISFYKNKEK